MISQKIRASARLLGLGLLALSVSAPAAMAGAKGGGAQCPFTSKDIDGWYKDIGFDTGADDAGAANVSCAVGTTYVTLDEIETRSGQRTVDGEIVNGLNAFKHILVDVQLGGSYTGPKYSIDLVRDGAPIDDPKRLSDVTITANQYDACISELISSQAWNRWSCGKQ